MTISIVMCGAAGRVGTIILRCAADDPRFEIAGAVEMAGSPAVGKPIGQLIGRPEIAQPVEASLDGISAEGKLVAIHFSSPEATVEQLEWSVANRLPAIIGTTGLKPEQIKKIRDAAHRIPVVFAPNMSIGVNVLFKIVGDVARVLGESYDIEIAEMHHRFKKDAPSGTARRLGEIAAEAMGGTYDDLVVDGRSGMTGERPGRQIGMHALRGGDVVGEHTVTFATLGERLELTHRAHNRETFAHGALRAAAWAADQPAGLYDMQDVLGIR